MGYTKQNFIKGQILKADHLNAMELPEKALPHNLEKNEVGK